jgi:hypothetical protein
MLERVLQCFDSVQRDTAVLAVPVAVAKKFTEDGADALGVQIAYWGFFSVFALLLAFVSILGFVFQSDPGFRQQVIDSTLERMPVIGPQISGSIGTLTGSGIALALGVASAPWTGLGVTLAIGGALDRIWGVPLVQRSGFVSCRRRGLAVLVLAGTVSVGAKQCHAELVQNAERARLVADARRANRNSRSSSTRSTTSAPSESTRTSARGRCAHGRSCMNAWTDRVRRALRRRPSER